MMSFIGIPIGFYGYVFPGNINLMVVELYSSNRFKFLFFTLGLILLFETFYCIVSLLLLNTLKFNTGIYNTIELASYIMVLLMGLWMLFENTKDQQKSKKNTVYRGLLSIVFHPQQIPFWVVMGVLVNKLVPFSTNQQALYQFAFFNAVGTFLAMLFYMVFGSKLFNYLKLNILQINKIMGSAYMILALYGLFTNK
ncbi:MAG TPA: hypothetical protein PL029_05540 [Bacteroidia bacterium]|nr:hypothetical protein [Bacteroidia bacterium]